MMFGNMPNDGGNFLLTPEEKMSLLAAEPQLERFIKGFIGAEEFINHHERYCLWLKHATPSDIRGSKELTRRVTNVRELRQASSAAPTREKANIPHLFFFAPHPEEGSYLLVPGVSSEKREYVPIGFFGADVVASNATLIVPNATLYHFGVLTSSVHMAWMRVVAGRLKSDYRYSAAIVYNNFPWPSLSLCDSVLKSQIEATAQSILDARTLYPDSSLADLYDPLTMPPELRKAHAANDAAVMKAYGFPPNLTEPEIVSRLFEMYAKLTGEGREGTSAKPLRECDAEQ